LAIDVSRIHAGKPARVTLGHQPKAFALRLRGYHPVSPTIQGKFDFCKSAVAEPGHHISMNSSSTDSVCPLPISIAST